MCQEHGPIVRGRGRLRRPGRWAIGTALCWRRGVHKLGHVPDPTDLQEDQIKGAARHKRAGGDEACSDQ
jgi:hypothetical protein